MENRRPLSRIFNRGLFTFIAIGIIIIIAVTFLNNFFYVFETVQEQEVGIQFQGGRITDVVGPGVYSDAGLYVDIQRMSTQAIPFVVIDEEIITSDKQRIGLHVSGDIFRPSVADADLIRGQWSQYRGIYLDNEAAKLRVIDLARQSMKVCVGDRTFDNNIIGTSRDALRACIDSETNQLVSAFGFRVENLVVPEVILSPEVQAALDAIVQSRLETEKAAQDELRAQAEASAEQARQEGAIRVEQSVFQEQARQQTALAVIEQERLIAQLEIIEAQRGNDLARIETERQTIEANKANDLLAAERDLAINLARAEAAEAEALAATAEERVLADLYESNPEYAALLQAQTNASALNATDKVIFTPEGTVPNIVIPGPGIVPTVNTTPQTTTDSP